MGIGISLVLLSIGALLRFATTADAGSFNVHPIGGILIVVGVVGLLVSAMYWSSWGGFGSRRRGTVRGNPPL